MKVDVRRAGAKLVVATSNAGKLRELSRFIPSSTELVSLAELGLSSPEETGRSFLDNAILKAEHASRLIGITALADDSGLEVDALDGRPGIHSARYAGPGATDEENNRKLVDTLRSQGEGPWKAKFVCAVALCGPQEPPITARGILEGEIVEEPRGANGFGYDPHFRIDDPAGGELNGRTLAELETNQKNRLSHRRRAYDALVNNARESSNHSPAARLIVDND